MNLRINFHDLTDEEKQLIFDFEDENPDQVLTKEISHSFDGTTILQFLANHADAIIQALGTIIGAIVGARIAVNAAKSTKESSAVPAELPVPDKDGVIHVDIHTSDELLYLWNALQNARNKMKVEDNGPNNK